MTRDALGRPLGTLRLSVTDRCNLRCVYCMPEDDYVWLPDDSILRADEVARIAAIFVSLGATEIRLTGGEPLLRSDLEDIVARIAKDAAVTDIALTTNGVLFSKRAAALKASGLRRVTFSIDTLREDRAKAMSRTTRLKDVLDAVGAAREAGFERTKINAVVIRDRNDDELVDLIDHASRHGAEVRFIEYMDVGGATRWSLDQVVSRAEMLARIEKALGPVRAVHDGGTAPADRFTLADGRTFGIIASTTAPFCRSCDRSRVTADGMWFSCLYAHDGQDLRVPLRNGTTDDALRSMIEARWRARDDRGAELRVTTPQREALVPLSRLRADPHKEMHTRGG